MTGDSGQLPRNDLAAEAIRRFGELRLRVTGTSMLPAIRPGDLLHVRRCAPDDAEPGDVVLFLRHSRLFAHRLISCTETQLLTRGDGRATFDPPVTTQELLGKVVSVTRSGRSVGYSLSQSWAGRLARTLFSRSAHAARWFVRLQAVRDSL